MFCLNIALGNIAWRLLFKTEETCNAACTALPHNSTDQINIDDDFGQKVRARPNAIHGWMVEDLDKTKLAHCELFLHQKRTEVAAVKMAQSDPGLRATQANQGPAIVTPFAGNGRAPF